MKNTLNIKDAYRLFHRGIQAFARAEQQGIRIDERYLLRQRVKLKRKIQETQSELEESNFYKEWSKYQGGKSININSPVQLGNFLYDYKGIKIPKLTKSGKGSVDDEALKSVNLKGTDLILQIRKLNKIRDTASLILRETVDGFLHPFFNLHTVRTYRSSSSDPNFQNIPIRDPFAKRILRRAFYPRKGHILLEIDYSGVEVRVSCCYHKDPNMINYVKDPTTDMHRDMAEQIYQLDHSHIGHMEDSAFKLLRGSAKNGFVFPQFYGDYYKNNADSIMKWINLNEGAWKKGKGVELSEGWFISDHMRSCGISSYNKFVDHLEEVEDHFWNERFFKYKEWKEKVWAEYQRKGYYQTLTGFVLKGVMRKNEFLNGPIQGSAFHCLLWSFVELDRLMVKEKWNTRLIGQIHDSIIMDVDPTELDYILETVKRVTCEDLLKEWNWIIVPLEIEAEICEIDKSWYTKKEIKI